MSPAPPGSCSSRWRRAASRCAGAGVAIADAVRRRASAAQGAPAVEPRPRGAARRLARRRHRRVRAPRRAGVPRSCEPRLPPVVASGAARWADDPPEPPRPRFRFDFTPTTPDVSLFPRARLATGARAGGADGARCGAGLRRPPAAASCCARRWPNGSAAPAGSSRRAERLVIVQGFAQGLDVVCAPARSRAAGGGSPIEDPALRRRGARRAPGRYGGHPVARRRRRHRRRRARCGPAPTRSSSRRPTSSRPASCSRPIAAGRCSTGREAAAG